RTSDTFSRRTSSWSCAIASCSLGSCSSANARLGSHLLGVDLLERRALLVPGDLPLRRVRRRHAEIAGRAELLGEGKHPLDQLLELRPRRSRLEPVEVDQLAHQAVADRAPEVLLDPAVRPDRQLLALVVGPCDARGERIAERGERARLAEIGLRVAD